MDAYIEKQLRAISSRTVSTLPWCKSHGIAWSLTYRQGEPKIFRLPNTELDSLDHDFDDLSDSDETDAPGGIDHESKHSAEPTSSSSLPEPDTHLWLPQIIREDEVKAFLNSLNLTKLSETTRCRVSIDKSQSQLIAKAGPAASPDVAIRKISLLEKLWVSW